MYQLDKEEQREFWNEILEENNLDKFESCNDYIVLWNWKAILKSEVKEKRYVFVDENLKLLTMDDIKEFYDMITDEERKDCYPTINHFINEGLSINGTLERLIL
jgi:hypothetical protein